MNFDKHVFYQFFNNFLTLEKTIEKNENNLIKISNRKWIHIKYSQNAAYTNNFKCKVQI